MKTFLRFALVTVLALGFALTLSGQDRVIKRKVAIGRFTNETQHAKGLFYDRENDPMRKQAMDILSAKLAASEKFILLERDDLEVLLSENAAMKKLGADYIIVGSITEFGRKVQGQKKVFSSTKTQTVEAGVSIRLVDTQTGMIIYSDEARGFAETTSKKTLGNGGYAGYDATLADKAISAALSQLVENIINKCMDKPWRSYILSVDDGAYIISGGPSQGIKAGDSFNVYKKGKTVKNPQTGLEVELPGQKLGTVTILSFFGDLPESEISVCSYSGADINALALEDYYISDK